MRRASKDTRAHIIEVAYDCFFRQGFSRTGVDAVAEAAGVTKRTLYYHFDSKDALIAAVLGSQHRMVIERIQRWAQQTSGDPSTITDMLFEKFASWASEPKWQGSGFTRIAMELADLPGHPARLAARRHKAALEDWFALQLAESGRTDAGILARRVMLLLEGCLSLVLIHGDTAYAKEAAEAARQLLLKP
jgi:AcrR family transcriptional regulator